MPRCTKASTYWHCPHEAEIGYLRCEKHRAAGTADSARAREANPLLKFHEASKRAGHPQLHITVDPRSAPGAHCGRCGSTGSLTIDHNYTEEDSQRHQVLCNSCNKEMGEPPHHQFEELDEEQLSQEVRTRDALEDKVAELEHKIACMKKRKVVLEDSDSD